jgi:hypothetical protein
LDQVCKAEYGETPFSDWLNRKNVEVTWTGPRIDLRDAASDLTVAQGKLCEAISAAKAPTEPGGKRITETERQTVLRAIRHQRRSLDAMENELTAQADTNNVIGITGLLAVIESGVAIPMWVGFGVDDDAFGYLDIGRKRTAGDIFSINGVPNAKLAAAAVRWIHAYENGNSKFNEGGDYYKPVRDPAPLYEYYETLNYVRVQNACKAGQWFGQNRVPSPAVATACHYVCAGKNAAQADDFFRKVATAIGFKSKSEPEYKLRDRLVSRVSVPMPAQSFAFIIQTWNATRQNKRIVKLVHEGGKLPRAV